MAIVWLGTAPTGIFYFEKNNCIYKNGLGNAHPMFCSMQKWRHTLVVLRIKQLPSSELELGTDRFMHYGKASMVA
jgi:hypothetical protein